MSTPSLNLQRINHKVCNYEGCRESGAVFEHSSCLHFLLIEGGEVVGHDV